MQSNFDKIAQKAYEKAEPYFKEAERICEINTARVMRAFKNNRVSESMFGGSTGYAYSDNGRDALEAVYAEVFGAEAAIVRLGFVNGTHAIGCALFAGLKSGDTVLSVTGSVYDTLQTLVGTGEAAPGSFADYGISYRQTELGADGLPDFEAIRKALNEDSSIKKVFIQRSRGYNDKKKTLSCRQIKEIIEQVKSINSDIIVMVDNCYGEFADDCEPCHVGADLIAGSLIKNPGGSLAPTGGYVAGRRDLVDAAAARLTVPGIGGECGATLGFSRLLFQGFFMAPHIVKEAIKTVIYCSALMSELGFAVSPEFDQVRHDIIQTVSFGSGEQLVAFCNGIQSASPVDSFVTAEPWDMPGYDCPVVMAAGTFVQGASIELSCDGPVRPPYTAYMQGGITFESGKLCITEAARQIYEQRQGKGDK